MHATTILPISQISRLLSLPRKLWAALITPPKSPDPRETRWVGDIHTLVLTAMAGWGTVLCVLTPLVSKNKPGSVLACCVILLATALCFATLRCAPLKPLRHHAAGLFFFTLIAVPAISMLFTNTPNASLFAFPVLAVMVAYGGGWGLWAMLFALGGYLLAFLIPALIWQPPVLFSPSLTARLLVLAILIAMISVPVRLLLRRSSNALRLADIAASERDSAKHYLAQMESRYRAVVDTMAEGMIVFDADGQALICNPAAERIFGLSRAQMGRGMLQNGSLRMVRENGAPFALEDHPLTAPLRTRRPCHGEVMGVVFPQGETKWITVNSMTLTAPEGAGAPAVLATFVDITDTHLNAAALRESEEKFAKTFHSNPACIWVSTLDQGAFLELNEAFTQATGFGRDDLVGKTPEDTSLWASATQRDSLLDSVRRGIRVRGQQVHLRKASGEIMLCEISADRVYIHGTPCVVCSAFDITLRMRAEDALAGLNRDLEQMLTQRTAQLEHSKNELEAFRHAIAHDLRAPLRAVNALSATILKDHADSLTPASTSLLQRVNSGGLLMGALVDDLLELERISRQKPQRRTVNLSEIAAIVVTELRDAGARRATHVDISPNMSAHCDPGLIKAVFASLLGNAMKFSAKTAQAHVEVGMQIKESKKVYFIRDNGAGFEMAFRTKLFTAFQRLHGPDDFEGNGVGLATVKRVIENHGGTVWAEGEKDKGACFYFTLE